MLPRLGPFTASTNFSADILGELDTRPDCWGMAGCELKEITFAPPKGYRVRILRIMGDLVSWPLVWNPVDAPKPGEVAGVLLGFQTTGPEGSVRGDWMADNTFGYLQDAVADKPSRAMFNFEPADALLGTDHKMVVKMAAWLNTMNKQIHMEPTFTFNYEFVSQE